jgi:hypothetical protein
MRTQKEIEDAIKKYESIIWYGRSKLRTGWDSNTKELKASIIEAEKEIENKIEHDELWLDDFNWAMANGKLSALRWLQGEEWDMLDT